MNKSDLYSIIENSIYGFLMAHPIDKIYKNIYQKVIESGDNYYAENFHILCSNIEKEITKNYILKKKYKINKFSIKYNYKFKDNE